MEIYLVGGTVRDQLLGLEQVDRDWVVVGATPAQMLALGYRQVGRDFPVFLHPQTREAYALARTERKTGSGHTAFACNSDPGVTLQQDLLRRDLTINAIARDDNGQLIDPCGGVADLEAGILRHVSPAFVEDPLRVLRTARFAARLHHRGFRVHPQTLAVMAQISAGGELSTLPSERIWKELEQALLEISPVVFFEVLQACGCLDKLLPALVENQPWRSLQQPGLASLSAEERFALLLSDLSAEAADNICADLRPPKRFRELALLCVELGPDYQDIRQLDAEALLLLLERCDVQRRPERFSACLRSCGVAWPQAADSSALLEEAARRYRSVEAGQLAGDNLNGRQLGQRLRQLRLRQLHTLEPTGE